MHGYRFLLCVSLSLVLESALGTGSQAAMDQSYADSQPSFAGRAEERPVSNAELVRNGGFDRDKAAWATNQIGTYVCENCGKDGVGKGMQIWPEFAEPYIGFIFQEVYLPTTLTSATFSVDYQFVPDAGATMDYFNVVLATESTTLAAVVNVTAATYPGELWQSTGSVSLEPAELGAIGDAHSRGERVYVTAQLRAQSLKVNVDNVSFVVSGSKEYPAWSGSIAYIGLDDARAVKSVRRIQPDGTGSQTLWTHPQSGITNGMYDVAWKPDASEVAFVSNHETMYSAFHSDVYGIGPEGSGLRRITNPPSKAALDAGGYQFGTVTGKVHNNYGDISSLLMYIQGAKDAVSVPALTYRDEVAFTVPDVAYLGSGLHYVVFIWAGGGSSDCREYAAAVVQAMPGQTVDAGTIQFGGMCGTYDSSAITWKRDGSELGVDVITPRRFLSEGQSIGSQLFNAPALAETPAWSPVDDRVLYYDGTYGEKGIYLTSVGGDRGTQLVGDQYATWVAPAWLPDGSGYVLGLDNYLYQHGFGGGQPEVLLYLPGEYALNPSVSPDGRYIVYERWDGVGQHDLWIVDRTNPVETWQVTSDGTSTDPDWSRRDPAAAVTPSPTTTPTATDEPTATPSETEAPTLEASATATPPTTEEPTPTTEPTTEPTTATGEPTATHTVEPSLTPAATPHQSPTPSPYASVTWGPPPTYTVTPGPGATDTPSPAATGSDTAVPTIADEYRVYLPVAKRGE